MINHLQYVFLINFFQLLWEKNRILFVMDILGLILALFPTISISPSYIVVINILSLFSTTVWILYKREYRVLTTPEKVLLEHTYHINALALSPNEKLLASSGSDKYVILWNPEKKKVLQRLQHESWVGNVVFSPDNQFLYTLIGKNGTFSQWDINAKTLIHQENWHFNQTRGLAISKSGELVAISCEDGTFSYFNPTEKSSSPAPFKLTEGELNDIQISENDLIATANTSGEVFLINLKEDPTISIKKVYQDENNEMIRKLSFNSEATFLAFTDSGGFLKLLNLETYKIVSIKAHEGHAIGVAFNPTSKFIATGGQDNMVRIWEIKNKHFSKVLEIQDHTDDVTSLVFDHNMRLYSASRDSTIKIWNLTGLY